MNQEFYISVTPVRGDEYLVRTERVSPGVPLAEELVTWQVEEWLEQARQLMHDPLLGILRGRMGSLSPSATGSDALSPNLVELGQKLYNALFQGTIRDSWVTAQGIAQNRREGLRLRLGLKGDRLPRLPWEVLHAGARPLATGTDVVFSRYQAAFAPMGTILQPHRSATVIDANQPLRILMVLAAPTDQEVLELRREANHLRDELKEEANGKIDLTILDQPGREQLTQALEQGHYQVLHYAGHSNLGLAGGDLYLVSDRTGLTEVLSGDDLAGLLVNNGIRMAVFNSCRGVYTATADPTNETESSNLTDALLKRGIPAVLAMAERIPDDVALTLSRLFYRNLKQRYPIDLSLSRARQGLLSSYGSNQLYWALPILYLHPDFDGYLQPTALPSMTNAGQEPQPANFAFDPLAIANDPADLDEAEMLFDDLEFADPEDSDRQAVLELLQELHEPTENPFSQARAAEPFFEPLSVTTDESTLQNPEDCLAVGRMRAQAENLTGAIIAYGRAIELDPQCAEAFSEMGVVLEKLGSPTEAIVAYKMALQHEPSLSDARRNLQRLETAHNLGSGSNGGAVQPSPNPVVPELHVEDVTFEEPMPNRIFGEMKAPSAPRPRRPWIVAGILGTAVAAVLGVWGFSTWRASTTPSPSELIDNISQINQSPGANVSRSNNLVATATTALAQGNLRQGQDAIEELLNNGELVAAETAIQNVPADKRRDNPTANFLLGRIAWQSVQARKSNYKLDDAQRFFETSLAGNRTPQTLNALGFVYYAQGNFGRAGRTWLNAEKLAAQAGDAGKLDRRTALAGLALVANKTAQSQTGNQRNQLRQQAVATRDRLLREAGQDFQIIGLSKNWLWSEAAIADWKALIAVK